MGGYYTTIWAVVIYIENRLQSQFLYSELERESGFSLAHLRALFTKTTGLTLSRYILSRRIGSAAFDIIHTEQSLIEISQRYCFSNPDTFTRAFRRVTGCSPSEFRRRRMPVGRAKICPGVYGVSERKGIMNVNTQTGAEGSTILYGVPKVGYGAYGGCTPYPICVKACANYLGEDVDYDFVMTASGAAFRLTWDTTEWNGGNVDVCFTFDEYETVYSLGVTGVGRKFDALWRTADTKKQDFIGFIKNEIDNGRPCIATGIIGPPEACVITGYRDHGETLLGWNFFQDSPEFAGGDVKFDESGYFISSTWWENRDTQSVMAIGPVVGAKHTLDEIVSTAVVVLTGRQKDQYAKGILAYDAWKKALSSEREFSKNASMAVLVERMMCQGDAMDCLADGRSRAGSYFEKMAAQHPERPLLAQIAKDFKAVASCANQMAEALGGWARGEVQLKALAQPDVRKRLCELIDQCKAADERALQALKGL